MKRLTTVASAATLLAAAQGSVSASTVPDPIDDIRHAKIELVEFLLDHVDRPTRVGVPCPSLPAEAANQLLAGLGLVPSSREYGVAVAFDSEVGDGLASLRCGVDIARSAEPAGSVAVSIDVTALDGQATFDQYAVDLAGDDATTVPVDGPPAGEMAQRCTNGASDCTTAFHTAGLVVTTRMRGLPAETSAPLATQFTVSAAPAVIANLAGLAAADE